MDDRELRQLATEIVKALKSADRQVGVQSSGSKGGSSRDRVVIDTKTTNKSLGELNKKLKDVSTDLNNQTKLLGMSKKELIAWQDKLFEGVVNNEKLSNKSQDKLRKKIEKTLKAQTKFGDSILEIGGDMKSLGKIMKETGDFMDHYNDILEEVGEKTLDNIQDMEALKKSVDGLIKSSKNQKAITDMIAAQGSEGYRKAAAMLDEELKSKAALRDEITKTAGKFGKAAGIIDKFGNATKEVGKGILSGVGLGGLAAGVGIAGLITAAFASFTKRYEDYIEAAPLGLVGGSISTSGVGDALDGILVLTKQLMQFGLTVKEYTDIIRKNYVTFARLGSAQFMKAGGMGQKQIMQTGEGIKESFAGSIAMAGAAQQSGVDIKNPQILESVMQKQIEAFKLLKIATGETSEEFVRSTLAITQSSEYEAQTAGLGKKKRSALFFDMLNARMTLAKIGFQSTSLQQSILKQMMVQQNAKVTDRFKMSADVMQASVALGMGSEGDTLRKILLKGGSASAAENVTKASLLASMIDKAQAGKKLAAAKGDAGLGEENLYDAILEKITPLLTDANKANAEKNNPNTLQGSGLVKRAKDMQTSMQTIESILAAKTFLMHIQDPLAGMWKTLKKILAEIKNFSFSKWMFGDDEPITPPTTKQQVAALASNYETSGQGNTVEKTRASTQAALDGLVATRNRYAKLAKLDNSKYTQNKLADLDAKIAIAKMILKRLPTATSPAVKKVAPPKPPKVATKGVVTTPPVAAKTTTPNPSVAQTSTKATAPTTQKTKPSTVPTPVTKQPTISKEEKLRADIAEEKEKALTAANSVVTDKKDITKMSESELLQKILLILEAEYVIISDDYQLKRRQGAFQGFENLGLAGT